MNNVVDSQELTGMVEHWLGTPPNGYLGSSYGSEIRALLQKPNSAGLGDQFIDKMAEDIPLVGALPSGAVNVYFEQRDKESKRLLIEVADRLVAVDEARFAD